jgi:hypothetical protein
VTFSQHKQAALVCSVLCVREIDIEKKERENAVSGRQWLPCTYIFPCFSHTGKFRSAAQRNVSLSLNAACLQNNSEVYAYCYKFYVQHFLQRKSHKSDTPRAACMSGQSEGKFSENKLKMSISVSEYEHFRFYLLQLISNIGDWQYGAYM